MLKEYKEGSLTHPTDQAFQLLLTCEMLFRAQDNHLLMSHFNVKKYLTDMFLLATADVQFPVCHTIKNKLIGRYTSVRLHILSQKLRRERKKATLPSTSDGQLGSKSMAMRHMVKHIS